MTQFLAAGIFPWAATSRPADQHQPWPTASRSTPRHPQLGASGPRRPQFRVQGLDRRRTLSRQYCTPLSLQERTTNTLRTAPQFRFQPASASALPLLHARTRFPPLSRYSRPSWHPHTPRARGAPDLGRSRSAPPLGGECGEGSPRRCH